jgi:regulator of cell morphogenesis and NO signaling
MSKLDTDATIGQWVTEYPSTARVFEDLRIDYCCGGGATLQKACGQNQLDLHETVDRLLQATKTPQVDATSNWSESSLTSLCDHIEQTHHAYLRDELPRLTAIIEKVVTAHSDKHPELRELQQVFAALREELEPHMFKEEQILFPAIRHMEQAASRPEFPFGTVANPIRMMEHEHDAAGNGLTRIRKLASDFSVPDGACNTYRVMLDGLRMLEEDTHRHIHKENNILFPRALELETAAATP